MKIFFGSKMILITKKSGIDFSATITPNIGCKRTPKGLGQAAATPLGNRRVLPESAR
jgi:hypothetical protein